MRAGRLQTELTVCLKSGNDIEHMRRAGKIVSLAHQCVARLIRPGITTAELDQAVEAVFAEHGAQPLFKGVPGVVPYPAATCISVEDEVVHGIPGDRRLKQGEIVSVDTGCRLDGWCADAAWSYPVGEVDPLRAGLLQAGRGVLERAIQEMGRQTRWSEVAGMIEQFVASRGYRVVTRFTGHGIGREMHENPQVPNTVSADLVEHDITLEPGLVIAVEPILTAGADAVRVLEDYWTVVTRDGSPTVHFEHTIAITAAGPEVLTAGIGLPAAFADP